MLYITDPQIQQGSKVQSKYSSSWDCARQLYRHGGVANLYQGTMATMLRGQCTMELAYTLGAPTGFLMRFLADSVQTIAEPI